MKHLLSILSLFVTVAASATTWDVEVGGQPGTATLPYYAPQTLTIAQGDEVIWTWVSGMHNVTSTSGPVNFSSGTLSSGAQWSFIFNTAGVYEYECTQGNHAATQFGTITVEAPNSVAEPVLGNFGMYPNPAAEFVVIERNASTPVEVRILDLSGRVVSRAGMVADSRVQLDVQHLNAGIYFVELSNGADVVRRRLTVR